MILQIENKKFLKFYNIILENEKIDSQIPIFRYFNIGNF